MAAHREDGHEGCETVGGIAPAPPSPAARAPRNASFLVRFWQEPRDIDSGQPLLRGYVRNLRTGAERYVSGLEELPEQVRSALQGEPFGSNEQQCCTRRAVR